MEALVQMASGSGGNQAREKALECEIPQPVGWQELELKTRFLDNHQQADSRAQILGILYST